MKLAILFSLALALLFAQQQRVVRPDTSTQRVSGQPPKLILAL